MGIPIHLLNKGYDDDKLLPLMGITVPLETLLLQAFGRGCATSCDSGEKVATIIRPAVRAYVL